MQYSTIGRSGLTVSRIGLGCMSFGTPEWWKWVLDEDAAKPIFRRAVELGINFFDTADSYSNGVSEEITGRWVREFAVRDEAVIATKVFFGPNRPNMRGLSRKHIEQACEASLKRLGVGAIDLYQIHRLDPQTPLDEVLAALDSLVRRGLVRYIGASSMYAWEFAKALSHSDLKELSKFCSMQNHYNLLYREEEREMVPLCLDQGVGLIPWSPLARGILSRGTAASAPASTERSTDDRLQDYYRSPADERTLAALSAVAARRDVTTTEIALAWMLAKPAVAAPIVGVSKPEHLEVAARSVALALTPAEMAELEQFYEPKPTLGITPPYAVPRPGQIHDRDQA